MNNRDSTGVVLRMDTGGWKLRIPRWSAGVCYSSTFTILHCNVNKSSNGMIFKSRILECAVIM